MPQKNEFTLAIESIEAELKFNKKIADKAKPVPFGLERVTSRSAQVARFQELNEAERRGFIKRHGLKETVKMMRK